MLSELPLLFVLLGIAAYAVLAGADFGAGIWVLISGRRDARLRDHARHAMGPVWEANHVWLVFVIVVAWTAYPLAFSSIASTLAVPLLIAAIGLILRGTAYALHTGSEDDAVAGWIERIFGVSSILTPFALGTVAGAIASRRVPVGNAAGGEFSSWLHPTAIVLGALSVAMAFYLAAVYLAADARRQRAPDLVAAFRGRALASGVLAGGLAVAALLVVREDAPMIWHGLTGGAGPAALAVSGAGGVGTLALLAAGRYEAARVAAALAVAAVIAGWAIAQSPDLLPGLTVADAAAGHTTLIGLVLSVAGGAFVLVPSLALLFRLTLAGRFDPGAQAVAGSAPRHRVAHTRARLVAAAVLLAAGVPLTVLLDSGAGLAVGVAALLGFAALGFAPLALPPDEG